MADTIKEKDFIEIDYTGTIKDDNIVFDTTDEKTAKENGLMQKGMQFGPITICIGEGHMLKGLENKLIGKSAGKYKIELKAEEAFGKKSAGLFQLVSTGKFKKQNINPMPGLQVEIDGMNGIIKSVSGGRTMVDFNHPLASKDLSYDITVKRIIIEPKEKADALLISVFRIKSESTTLENGEFKVKLAHHAFPKEVENMLSEKLTSLVPEIKKVIFEGKEIVPKTMEKANNGIDSAAADKLEAGEAKHPVKKEVHQKKETAKKVTRNE